MKSVSGTAKKPLSFTRIAGLNGFAVYTALLMLCILLLPDSAIEPGGEQALFVLGTLAVWRYSWGLIHYVRSEIYRRMVFPRLRQAANPADNGLTPPHLYLLVTSFRIDGETTARVFQATIREAINCGIPTTIVASLVELADEFLFKELFRQANPPENVTLQIVRIPGTGKRDGLAQGFRAISRSMPMPGSIVAVIDGDSVLEDGLVRKCVPFFSLMPNLGALTTDEECDVRGSRVIREWHHLRFAQRQVLMCSVALSRKVLTLTGRMSMFRAEIICHPDFIRHVEEDSINHWRLGRFKFLTGDDKSSWFWVLKSGYDMLYVPDTVVMTVEHPPSENFFKATTQLMFRWFGNMLRTNGRALALGPHRIGFFTWWCVFDQRISMWTALTGPAFVTLLSFSSLMYIPIYVVWVGLTRWVMALMLLTARPVLSWYYPFLIYYNQIWGSLIKTYVFFRLDRQSWTRQKTKLSRGLTPGQQRFIGASSVVMHGIALTCFVTLVGLISGIFTLPDFWH